MDRRMLIKTLAGVISTIPLGIKASPVQVRQDSLLLLQESPLAGFQYYQGESLWEQLREGQRLGLIREKENRYDERAVAVYWQDQKLGYIPRDENVAISQLLDRGGNLTVNIMRLKVSSNPWKRIKMKIFYVT